MNVNAIICTYNLIVNQDKAIRNAGLTGSSKIEHHDFPLEHAN